MIAITGATGFVGMAHLMTALRAGQAVKVLARDRRALEPLATKRLQIIEGDLSDACALEALCEGVETCFHYAARARFQGDWKTFEAVNLHGTENLLRAAARVDRFIFCSSYSSILADVERHEADEALPYPRRHLDGYGRSKALAEQACLRMHPGATVLRPPWIWGAGDTNNLAAVLRAHHHGQLYTIRQGQHLIETVHVQNLIHAAVLASRQDAARGQVYFVTDDQPIPHRDFCQQLLQSCGLRPSISSMPYPLAWMLCRVDRAAGYRLGMTRSALSYMSRTKTFSDAKIRTELGYTAQVSRAAGLEDLRRWAEHVGGAEQIRIGRRRGTHRALIAQTQAHLRHDRLGTDRAA